MILGTIGNGSKPVAFKTHILHATKHTRKENLDRIYEEIRHDAKLMDRIKSGKGVVRILGLTFNKNNPFIIVELGQDDLGHYLEEAKEHGDRVPWPDKARFCNDVVMGLKALDKCGVVHGDLKAENVIVFMINGGSLTAKILDFGYSFAISSNGKHEGGTINFRAPECTVAASLHPKLAPWSRDPRQDIYGLGLLVWQTAMDGARPYSNALAYEIEHAKANDLKLMSLMKELPGDVPNSFVSVIASATRFWPEERSSLDEIQRGLREVYR